MLTGAPIHIISGRNPIYTSFQYVPSRSRSLYISYCFLYLRVQSIIAHLPGCLFYPHQHPRFKFLHHRLDLFIYQSIRLVAPSCARLCLILLSIITHLASYHTHTSITPHLQLSHTVVPAFSIAILQTLHLSTALASQQAYTSTSPPLDPDLISYNYLLTCTSISTLPPRQNLRCPPGSFL